jgi:hypothetical protein
MIMTMLRRLWRGNKRPAAARACYLRSLAAIEVCGNKYDGQWALRFSEQEKKYGRKTD